MCEQCLEKDTTINQANELIGDLNSRIEFTDLRNKRLELVGNQFDIYAVVQFTMDLGDMIGEVHNWQNKITDPSIIGYFATEKEAQDFIDNDEALKDCMAPMRYQDIIVKI